MNRYSDIAIKDCAKAAIERYGSIWPHFSDTVRDALLDAAIMDAVRAADAADSHFTFSAHELVEFRAGVAQALAGGVMVGRTKRGLTFDRDREDRRERDAYARGRNETLASLPYSDPRPAL